jgi:AcrR family transcriptional regulator
MRRSRQANEKSRAAPGQRVAIVRTNAQPAKTAVLRAFAELIGTKQYDEITVGEIIGRAGVSRSSFYEHFGGKKDLLTRSIAGPFKILADAIFSATQTTLVPLLEHFWSNRSFARGVLLGLVRRRTATVLVVEIENQLKRRETASKEKLRLPRRLLAWQLAESMLGLITAWLTGEARCSASELADVLSRTSQALLEAMQHRPPFNPTIKR